MKVIHTENLSKIYEYYEKDIGIKGSLRNLFKKKRLYKEAVKGLNIDIEEGSIVGFIGLNGAGKTTTLKMMTGILKPSCGNISVLGYTPFDKKNDYLKKITMVMGNKSQLWWDIPAIETFEMNREIYEVDKKQYKELLEFLTNTLNVEHLLNIQVRRLSLGERMKMELISSLLHFPLVMFLDEPTIGLDILSQYSIRDFLKAFNNKYNTTIILTSHNFDDIVHLCDRLLIIDKGEIICDSSFKEFLKLYSTKKILTIKFSKKINNLINELNDNNIEILEEKADEIKISVNEKEIIRITNKLTNNYFDFLKDINIENLDIKEIIKSIYY